MWGLLRGSTVALLAVCLTSCRTVPFRSDGKDRGSTFEISLPVAATVQAHVATTDPSSASSAPARSLRILLVEDHDNPKVCETIQLVFDKFLELGSAGAVTRYFRKHGIKLPRTNRRKTNRDSHRRRKG